MAGPDQENVPPASPPDETPKSRRKRKQRAAQNKRRLAQRDAAAAGSSGDAVHDAGTAEGEPSAEGDEADNTAGEDGRAEGRAGVYSGAVARLLIDELELALLQRLEEIEFKDKINDLQPAYGCRHARTALRVKRRASNWRCTARWVSCAKEGSAPQTRGCERRVTFA